MHIYVPGYDEIDTLEYTLLNASAVFSIPAASWRLCPIPAQADLTWSERPGDREAYLAARGGGFVSSFIACGTGARNARYFAPVSPRHGVQPDHLPRGA